MVMRDLDNHLWLGTGAVLGDPFELAPYGKEKERNKGFGRHCKGCQGIGRDSGCYTIECKFGKTMLLQGLGRHCYLEKRKHLWQVARKAIRLNRKR